jgi:hypothetical protein
VDGGLENMVAIGLHPSGFVKGMVGWEAHSFGYHADDGTFRSGAARHLPVSEFRCTSGDVMGCGVNTAEGAVYFTRNGKLTCGFSAPNLGDLYAVVTGADLAQVILIPTGFD